MELEDKATTEAVVDSKETEWNFLRIVYAFGLLGGDGNIKGGFGGGGGIPGR